MKSELDTALENLSELSSRINMWSDDMRICGMKQLIANPISLLKKWKAAAKFAESANTPTNIAMVPCRSHMVNGACELDIEWICAKEPCLIQKAQHQ